MCATCGCGGADVRVAGVPVVQDHDHDRDHAEEHRHDDGHADAHQPTSQPGSSLAPSVGASVVEIETAILAKNDDLARRNRTRLSRAGIVALNLMSSPGSGKTSLLERTIAEAPGRRPICVVEGDQETPLDADRIKATGAPVVQINTGSGCHLDATMFAHGLDALDPPKDSLLFVENVGNLVCPALFDLGEVAKVVVISVTEGDDKPLKYPHMFAAADLVVVNKTDLLPYVDFDLDRCVRDARSLNPGVAVLPLSVRSGEGLEAWYGWLEHVGE